MRTTQLCHVYLRYLLVDYRPIFYGRVTLGATLQKELCSETQFFPFFQSSVRVWLLVDRRRTPSSFSLLSSLADWTAEFWVNS
jgi:hypothetical protein